MAVGRLKDNWRPARLVLAVDAGTTAALAAYRAFAMTDSGPEYDGPNGRENGMEIALLALRPCTAPALQERP